MEGSPWALSLGAILVVTGFGTYIYGWIMLLRENVNERGSLIRVAGGMVLVFAGCFPLAFWCAAHHWQ